MSECATVMDAYTKKARHITRAAVSENHFRNIAVKDVAEQRVRISGLIGRLESLNGRYGTAGKVDSGKQRVVVDGMQGAAFCIDPKFLSRAPPAASKAVYNRGTGSFQLEGNGSRPRRCCAGSGQPSYSTRGRPQEQIPPPRAGSLLPRKSVPVDFHGAWEDGSLPVRLPSDAMGELRWLDPTTGAEVPRSQVDARRWLPVLIDGLRDAPSTGGAYVALRGAIELVGSAADAGILPALMPALAPALKAALDMRERSVVRAALHLLLLLLHADERVGLGLRPSYKLILPTMAAFALKGQTSLLDEIEYSQHRQINIPDLVEEVLSAMERKGGPGAGKIIKSYVPSHRDHDECLHRGFR